MFKKEKSEKEVKKSGLVEEIGSEKETTYCSKLIKEIIERPEFYETGLDPKQMRVGMLLGYVTGKENVERELLEVKTETEILMSENKRLKLEIKVVENCCKEMMKERLQQSYESKDSLCNSSKNCDKSNN